MSPYFRIAAAMASLAVAASPAVAQTAAAPAAAAGSSAQGNPASGAGAYRSAFTGFRGFAEQPVGSWRQANDLVGTVGGWRSYAREAQGAEAPASAAAATVPASQGHAGHKAP